MQTMYDWAQHIVRASARCFSSEDGDQNVVWETLVPRYCSSTVPALEARRENLAIALAGQLSVFFCRFLSGHWGASGVGLLVFVVGNNARCSLQVSELTCYLALAGGAGALDVLDLLQHLVAGTIAVHVPFADHLALNLQALGLLMAPCCEFYGGHIAYGCYLSPAMLFERDERMMMDPRQSMMDPRQSQMMSLYAYPHAAYHSLPPRLPDPMRTRMPPDAGWGDHVASMIPGWPGWQDVQAYMPGWAAVGAYQNQVDALASSSQEQPHASLKRRNSVDVACAECGATIPAGRGRCGTGDFFGCVYCSNCWSLWGSQSSS